MPLSDLRCQVYGKLSSLKLAVPAHCRPGGPCSILTIYGLWRRKHRFLAFPCRVGKEVVGLRWASELVFLTIISVPNILTLPVILRVGFAIKLPEESLSSCHRCLSQSSGSPPTLHTSCSRGQQLLICHAKTLFPFSHLTLSLLPLEPPGHLLSRALH